MNVTKLEFHATKIVSVVIAQMIIAINMSLNCKKKVVEDALVRKVTVKRTIASAIPQVLL